VTWKKPTAGIILAAGMSKRFGTPKQLVKIKGSYMIEHVIRASLGSNLHRVFVVLGHQQDKIYNAVAKNIKRIQNSRFEIVSNRHYRQGMSSSVRSGLCSAGNAFGSVMFLLGDQPLVDSGLINLMLKQYYRSDKKICVPAYKGKRGNPAIFSSEYFSLLENVKGDSGGKDIIKAHPDDILKIETDSPHCTFDIDAPSDLEKLKTIV
jgi:molybdenum cofactor cytidylyltransferase